MNAWVMQMMKKTLTLNNCMYLQPQNAARLQSVWRETGRKEEEDGKGNNDGTSNSGGSVGAADRDAAPRQVDEHSVGWATICVCAIARGTS